MIYVVALVFIVLTILMCWQESQRRKISFPIALILCLVATPIFGLFIIQSRPLRNARGCSFCGNEQNEAEYCGICGKNELGELRPSKVS